MFKNLTYQQKLKLLGAAVIPVLLVCYELSIKRTVKEYTKYEHAVGSQTHLTGSTADLNGRELRVNDLYRRYALDTFAPEKNLLSIASNYCRLNDLTLKEYKTVSLAKTDSIRVLTRKLVVEGHFVSGLRLIYDLETKWYAGRISSVAFTSFVDLQDKSVKLDCTLYVQNAIP